MMFAEKSEVLNEKQRLFIRRERVRRELLKVEPGETICLNFEQVALLTRWIKELETMIKATEERMEKHGNQKH